MMVSLERTTGYDSSRDHDRTMEDYTYALYTCPSIKLAHRLVDSTGLAFPLR